MSKSKINKSNWYYDLSLWSLIIANFFTMILAIKDGWGFLSIMWCFWLQSVIIIFFGAIKIFFLKEINFSTIKDNGKYDSSILSVSCDSKWLFLYKILFLFYYILMYAFTFFVYAMFLFGFMQMPGSKPDSIVWSQIILATSVLFINHLFSLIYNFSNDKNNDQDINKIIEAPFRRILPMHIMLMISMMLFLLSSSLKSSESQIISNIGEIFSLGSWLSIFIFISLKTFIDVKMHIKAHKNSNISFKQV